MAGSFYCASQSALIARIDTRLSAGPNLTFWSQEALEESNILVINFQGLISLEWIYFGTSKISIAS
jgi:hypothetical protein